MDVEVQPILDVLQDSNRVQIAAWTFWRGRIGKQSVVVSRTEVGPTNATAATVLGIEHFRPRLIINQGCAGGHIEELKIGDIVLGESCVEYGTFESSHGDAGSGVKLERWRPRYNRFRLDGNRKTTIRRVAGDPQALEVAQATPYAGGKLVKGRIGSANQWNRELDLIAWNHRKFGTDSEDMESAFAAMVAKAFGTRFLAIRIISDNELRSPEVKIEETTAACARYVVEAIRRLGSAARQRS
jgi:adenosylhomocysteine nucleosidase